ncbi:transcription factor SOX-3-like [Amphibalanus amphitrite]|uniref:transcription factor SOX-3-like n=1 Tax=Amphibalanus amphitrite TaxID=1232801 RepID=UPI001C926390|nr:transcription factor SOX-3-like [Amphibalanus amphitrite]
MNRTPYYTHVYRPPGHDSAAYPAASAAAAAAAASRLGTYSLPGGAFHAAWQAGLPYPVRPAAPAPVPVRPEPERAGVPPPPRLHRHDPLSAAAAAAAADQYALEQRRYKQQLAVRPQQLCLCAALVYHPPVTG